MKKSFKEKLFGVFFTFFLYLRIFKMRMLWLFTYKKDHPIAKYETITSIPLALKWGNLYKADPLRDPVYHPTQIQKSLDEGKKIGDCDDHAIYWCASLLKNKLAKRVWLSMYFFTTANNKREGHAICVFQGLDDKFYWGDYSTPVPVEIRSFLLPTAFEWLETAMKAYGAVKISSACMFEVKRLNWRETPVLTKPKFVGKMSLQQIIDSNE